MTSSAALASIKAPAAALRAPATVRRGRGRVTVAPIRAVSTAAEGSKLGAIVAAPLNLVGAPLNFIINNAIKGFKGGYARIRNFKPKA